LKILYRQNQEVKKNPPDGVTIINIDEFQNINAEIEGPVETPYSEGVFRIKLCFSSDFPLEPPKGRIFIFI